MISTINNSARKRTYSKSTRSGNFNKFHLPARGIKADEFKHFPVGLNCAGKSSANQILASAGVHGFDYLGSHLKLTVLRAGEELYSPGENSDYVYFPETAVVSHRYNLADGNTIEIAMIGREGATGLCEVLGSQAAMHQAMVSVEGNAWKIKTKILRQEFLRGGRLQTLLLDYFNRSLAQISQRVACESFHIMEKRLCSWLLMIHDRVKENQLNMTQEQMSLLLGVNRPNLTVVAKILRDAGLISYARGKVYILDRLGLEATACECYSAAQSIC